MVDLKTYRILDMINSREYEAVRAWLKTYENLRIISRDGSITYHNAIIDAHPNAIQISDRFHLLKNLTSYATDYLKRELKAHIVISLSQNENHVEDKIQVLSKSDENRKLTLKEKYEQIERLLSEGYSKTKICKDINMDVRAYDKLISMTPQERESSFQTKLMTIHEEKVKLKMERVNEVRELKKLGYNNCEISKCTGLDTSTIRKYLD